MKRIFSSILLTFIFTFGVITVSAETIEGEITPESTIVQEETNPGVITENPSIVENENTTIIEEGEEVSTIDGILQEGEVDVDKEAEIVPNPENTPQTEGDSRESEVSFEIESESFQVNGDTIKIDVSLVFDTSKSMDYNMPNSKLTRLDVAKEAAIKFVNDLFSAEGLEFRISLTTFDSDGTIHLQLRAKNEKETIIDEINDIEARSKTNIQDGIEKGASTLVDNQNKNVMIILSDGAPNTAKINWNYYDKVKEALEGKISNDCYNFFRCNSSDRAIIAAEYYRQTKNIDIYTIGLETDNAVNETLLYIAGDEDRFMNASDSDELIALFESLVDKIEKNKVADEVILTDIIPEEFEIKETIEQLAEKNNVEADRIEITKNEQTQETIIKYNIGELDARKDIIFKYTLKAKEDYHGSMYTNSNATLTGIPVNGNPFEFVLNNGRFTLETKNPSVVIPAITENDFVGAVYDDSSSTITTEKMLENDIVSKPKTDNAVSVKDELVIITNPQHGTLSKVEGGYKYTPNTTTESADSFTYRILTIAEYSDGTKKVVKSNVSTVSLTIIHKIKLDYTIQHYKDNELQTDETYTDSIYVWSNSENKTLSTANYEAVEYNGYKIERITLNDIEIESIPQIVNNEDTIKIYYEKDTFNYVVKYVDKDTQAILQQDKESFATFEEIIAAIDEKIEIETYNYDSANIESIKIGVDEEENILVLYYTKIIGKVIVYYVDEEGKDIADFETLEGHITTDYVTEEKEIDEYVLKEIQGSKEGKFLEEDTIVTYVYEQSGIGGEDLLVVKTGLNDSIIFEILFISSLLSIAFGIYYKKRFSN